MIAQDVKLLCPAELRDTCMLLFHHMQKAFSGITFGGPKGPARISTKQQQQQQAGEGGGSGSSSPKINRSQSDGMQGSSGTSLSRSSLGAAGALRRHGSSDAVPTADPTGGVGPNSSSAAGSSSVATPAEEERMLQAILGQNAEAAAAAAAAERKRAAARARELQARSGSAGGGASAGGASTAPTDSFVSSVDSSMMAGGEAEGLGHAAAAIRALRAAGGGNSGAAAGRGQDDAGLHESPHSGTLSDISHLSATDSSVALSSAAASGVAPEPHPAAAAQDGSSSGGGLGGFVEQMLLEYEIEFVQVQVRPLQCKAADRLITTASCKHHSSNTAACWREAATVC
jgi:hypothetical protein